MRAARAGKSCVVSVRSDFSIHFLAVTSGVVPRIGEILGSKSGIIGQKPGLAATVAAKCFEQPDRDARADDASRATADVRSRINAGMGVRHLERDERKQAHLISFGEMENGVTDVVEGGDHGGRVS